MPIPTHISRDHLLAREELDAAEEALKHAFEALREAGLSRTAHDLFVLRNGFAEFRAARNLD